MTRAPALSLEPLRNIMCTVCVGHGLSIKTVDRIEPNAAYLYNSTHQHRHRKSSAPSSSCVDALATTSTPPQPIAPSCAGGRTRRHSALRAYPSPAAPRGRGRLAPSGSSDGRRLGRLL